MKLIHTNKVLFTNIIDRVAQSVGMHPAFIEKDYAFMMLKLIYSKDQEIMFKGGTSLSKAWGILQRFSEDIDLNLLPEVPSTDSHRMKLTNAVYNSITDLGLMYDRSKMKSRAEYNTFIFDYNALRISPMISGEMKVETMANKKGKILNATYTKRTISNYIWDNLSSNANYREALINFGLQPFYMPTQNMDVTFVEKVMSLCNRYLRDESFRLSRHLYDIYCMWNFGNLSSFDLSRTMYETKQHLLERTNDKCLRQPISAYDILMDALYKDFYRSDFNTITIGLKYNRNDGITYEMCRDTLIDIVNRRVGRF